MRLFVRAVAVTIVVLTSRTASGQGWCEVLTARPYSRNMPGITSLAIASVKRASAPIENYPQNSYALASDTVTLVAGETYTFTIAHSRDSVAFPRAGNNIRAWIDYDKNGSFDPAKELAITGDALVPGVSHFTFTVPRNLTPVAGTRMRVTAKMSLQTGHSLPTPCDEPRDPIGYHGEIEDYPINIIKPPEGAPDVRSLESELARQLDRVSTMLVGLAERMPDDAYQFRATPATRTFVAAIGHTAIANINICSNLLQRRHALSGTNLSATLTTKQQAIDALKASVAFCTEYASALKPGELANRFFEVTTLRDGKNVPVRTPHTSLLANLIAHNNEMYGYLAVYLRLKGVVPPTSDS